MNTIDMNRIEIEARRMRAMAVRNAFIRFSAWVKSVSVTSPAGKTAH